MSQFFARVAAILLGLVVLCAPAAAAPEPMTIVAFGDSLTAGLGLPKGEAFPAQLEAALKAKGYNVRVLNAGVSGNTAAAGLARVDWAIPEEADAVIVELGANDALRGLDPDQTRRALGEILARLEQRNLPVLLAGLKGPQNYGPEYEAEFAAIYPDLARKYDVLLYPFFLEDVAKNAALNQSDGLHPNAGGVAKIVGGILPKVEELIARVEKTPRH